MKEMTEIKLSHHSQNRAVPLHPGDWKLAKGIIPIALDYPTILGSTRAGILVCT